MRPKGFKAFVSENLGYKVLAVVTAISLWFFITYRGQSEMSVEAGIEFKNVPSGLEILKQNIKKVNLNIQGHERTLNWLKPSDVRLVIDLADGKRGEATYYFDASDVKAPPNVKVLRIDPNYARITLDESASASVPVKAVVIGTPRQGYSIRGISVDPSAVEIEGAKSETSRVGALRTEPLDITGLDSDISQSVKIDAGGRNVRLKTGDVTVKVSIGSKVP